MYDLCHAAGITAAPDAEPAAEAFSFGFPVADQAKSSGVKGAAKGALHGGVEVSLSWSPLHVIACSAECKHAGARSRSLSGSLRAFRPGCFSLQVTPCMRMSTQPDAFHAQEGAAEEAGPAVTAAAAAEEEEEDPAVRERLRRVHGEPSGQDLSRRVFVGGMPFTYEVRRGRPVSP